MLMTNATNLMMMRAMMMMMMMRGYLNVKATRSEVHNDHKLKARQTSTIADNKTDTPTTTHNHGAERPSRADIDALPQLDIHMSLTSMRYCAVMVTTQKPRTLYAYSASPFSGLVYPLGVARRKHQTTGAYIRCHAPMIFRRDWSVDLQLCFLHWDHTSPHYQSCWRAPPHTC